jgi:hypothetical protein
MVWLALIVGLFLFYKFVERRHKVIAFKLVGALFSITAVVIGFIVGQSELERRDRAAGIRVKLNDKHFSNARLQAEIVEKVFHDSIRTIEEHFPGLKPVDLAIVRSKLFGSWISSNTSSLSKSQLDFELSISDDEIDAMIDSESEDPRTAKVGAHRLKTLEDERASRMIAQLAALRERSQSGINRFLLASFIGEGTRSFSTEFGNRFSENLSREERISSIRFAELRLLLRERLFFSANQDKRIETKLSFEICNRRRFPLKAYNFTVSGYERDRSTPHSIRRSDSHGQSTDLQGDFIIPPDKCQTFDWVGDYKFFDRYEVTYASGRWGDD